ncbi:MAG: hypothetical protein ACWGNV_10225 [Bacteroidales bacterium]
MKTKMLALERCVPLILASVLILLVCGCSESPTVDPVIPEFEETYLASGNIISEQYSIGPEGGHITALGETVCLDFPENAVYESTLITISSFPIHQLDQYNLNLMNRAVAIDISETGTDNGFGQMVRLRLRYDFSSLKGVPVNENNLTIYTIYGNYYRHPNIFPIGECCVNCNCQVVQGCICESGTYVVGEL